MRGKITKKKRERKRRRKKREEERRRERRDARETDREREREREEREERERERRDVMRIEEVESTTRAQRIATHTHIKGLGLGKEPTSPTRSQIPDR